MFTQWTEAACESSEALRERENKSDGFTSENTIHQTPYKSHLLPAPLSLKPWSSTAHHFQITRGTKNPPDLQCNTAKCSLTCWHCSFRAPCFEGVSYNMFKKWKWTVLCKSQDSRNWSTQKKKKNPLNSLKLLINHEIWQDPSDNVYFFSPQSCTMLNIRSKQFSLADTGSALHSPSP